ncbi:MAG: UbiA family prenyltransferase [Desulfomicrobium apsheronum]|nr:UbiA family prenyltransferase [Desulfomicrobium apsheronum]
MIRDMLALIRPGISLAVGLSALAGYVMAAGALSGGGGLFAGTFVLSAAVSVLNQIQERGRDACMERTRSRPLASGRMSAGQGSLLFSILLALSAMLLWPLLSWRALPVLLVVLGLYNGLYTLMKPVTGWAMIPGAACGALPFWIGWMAGGGGLFAIEPAYFFALYFVWQMPHFWMLAESNADDYAAAGFPVPANSFSTFSRQAIPRIWTLALAMLGGMAPLFGLATGLGQAYALATVCPAYALLAVFARARVLRLASDGFLAGVVLMIVAERLVS